MSWEKTVFVAEIAGVPVEIRARFTVNKAFFSDWFSKKEPELVIEPEWEDLDRIRVSFEKNAAEEGRKPTEYRHWFLENNAIHDLLAESLISKNVLLMHGSALSFDGKGCLFTAPSGTGKSTHTRLWREAFGSRVTMINDDKPMLRVEENEVICFGTPWNGKHHLGGNISAPLCAIASIERSEENRIEPIDRSRAFPILLRQIYSPRSAELMRRTIELEQEIMKLVRFYRIGCNMAKEAAIVACRGIFGEASETVQY